MWWDVVRPQTNRLDNIDDKLLNMDDDCSGSGVLV